MARQGTLGGERRADAAAAGRGVRDLGVLVRRRARVPRLVRQPAGAVPPQRRRLRHAGSRARHLVPVDGPWEWKDDELLEVRVAEGRFTPEQVAGTWAEGQRVGALLDAGEHWWADAGLPGRRRPGWDAPWPARPVRCRTRPRKCDVSATEVKRRRVQRRAILGAVRTRPVSDTTPRRAPTLLGVRRARAVLGRVGVGAAERAGRDRGCRRARSASRCSSSPLGSIPAMFFVGRAARRALRRARGGRHLRGFAAATTLPGLAGSLPTLVLALAAAGAASGALDVAINANAARIETETGTRLMPLAHGLYSVGILVGAVGAGLARSAGAAARRSCSPSTIAIARQRPCSAPTTRRRTTGAARGLRIERALLADRARRRGRVHRRGRDRELERALPRAPAATRSRPSAASGRASSAARWRPGRFFGQAHAARRPGAARRRRGARGRRLRRSPRSRRTRRSRSSASHSAGAGISLNAPIVFGAGGRRGASAVATVTTLGYVGLLIGPPLVGGVAQARRSASRSSCSPWSRPPWRRPRPGCGSTRP